MLIDDDPYDLQNASLKQKQEHEQTMKARRKEKKRMKERAKMIEDLKYEEKRGAHMYHQHVLKNLNSAVTIL